MRGAARDKIAEISRIFLRVFYIYGYVPILLLSLISFSLFYSLSLFLHLYFFYSLFLFFYFFFSSLFSFIFSFLLFFFFYFFFSSLSSLRAKRLCQQSFEGKEYQYQNIREYLFVAVFCLSFSVTPSWTVLYVFKLYAARTPPLKIKNDGFFCNIKRARLDYNKSWSRRVLWGVCNFEQGKKQAYFVCQPDDGG